MSVDAVTDSLVDLRLGSVKVFRSDHGETYTVDSTTGATYVNETQRKDGSYRKKIPVRPGYIPQDERGAYVPPFRQKPKPENATTVTTVTTHTTPNRPAAAKKTPTKSEESTADATNDKKRTPRPRVRSSTRPQKEHTESVQEGSESAITSVQQASVPTASEPLSNVDIEKKIAKAIKNTKYRLRKLQAKKSASQIAGTSITRESVWSCPVLCVTSAQDPQSEALRNKIKRLEAALAEISVTKAEGAVDSV
ncbi:mago binding protein [Babesia caballi]|uniref:Mago binding protein n=1 Tax=Babesia caballi TaxID=5871 RepID=A0AAV4LQ52_BABCB|nr:mago binding protein [Babesia caballi]